MSQLNVVNKIALFLTRSKQIIHGSSFYVQSSDDNFAATARFFFSVQGPTVRVARRWRSDGQVAPGHVVHARHCRSGLRNRGVGQTMGGTTQPGGVRAGPRRRPRCRSARSSLSVRACHVQGLLNFLVTIANLMCQTRATLIDLRSSTVSLICAKSGITARYAFLQGIQKQCKYLT